MGLIRILTTLGKIIGGGLPCGAFGGRAEVMEFLAPLGPVYQAGTLSGNPLAMAAGSGGCVSEARGDDRGDCRGRACAGERGWRADGGESNRVDVDVVFYG